MYDQYKNAMNIQAEKIELAQLLLQTNSETLLKKIKALLKSEQKDWWDEISTEEKAEINAGVKEIESGNFLTHKEVMANPRKWH